MPATETRLKELEAWHYNEVRNTILSHIYCADINWSLKILASLSTQIHEKIAKTLQHHKGGQNKGQLMNGEWGADELYSVL